MIKIAITADTHLEMDRKGAFPPVAAILSYLTGRCHESEHTRVEVSAITFQFPEFTDGRLEPLSIDLLDS